jgi:membrane protease YdiL (CAAX protease family)
VFLLGVFAPGLIALALTEAADGRAATRTLFNRILKWDIGARFYVFAIAFIPAAKLLAALLHRIVTGTWPKFGDTPVILMLLALTVSTWAQAGEELGWRGYALPRMWARFGLGPASILLGIIWATWHLPLFFFPGTDTVGQSFPMYVLQVTAISVVMGWLYWRSEGSLLIVMLFHAAVNNLKDIVPSASPGATTPFSLMASPVGWLTVGILWIAASYFLVQMRNAKPPIR